MLFLISSLAKMSVKEGYSESEAAQFPHDSTKGGVNDGSFRVDAPNVDVGLLKEPITFGFSGRTAPNRFLKGTPQASVCFT